LVIEEFKGTPIKFNKEFPYSWVKIVELTKVVEFNGEYWQFDP